MNLVKWLTRNMLIERMTEMSSELKIPQFNISIEGDNFPHQTFMSWFKEKYKKILKLILRVTHIQN